MSVNQSEKCDLVDRKRIVSGCGSSRQDIIPLIILQNIHAAAIFQQLLAQGKFHKSFDLDTRASARGCWRSLPCFLQLNLYMKIRTWHVGVEQATSESISCLLPEMAVAMSNKLRFRIFGTTNSQVAKFIILFLHVVL